jgi:hypothetical protein
MELINNRPFESISSAAISIGIDRSTLYRNLDTDKPVVLRKVKLTVYFLGLATPPLASVLLESCEQDVRGGWELKK